MTATCLERDCEVDLDLMCRAASEAVGEDDNGCDVTFQSGGWVALYAVQGCAAEILDGEKFCHVDGGNLHSDAVSEHRTV